MKLVLLFLLLPLYSCVTVTESDKPQTQYNPVDIAESRIELGLAYLKKGQMDKAREHIEKAMQYAPNYYRPSLIMAHYFDQVGEVKKASQQYYQTLKQYPLQGDVLNNYGAFLCKYNQFKYADDLFNQAVKLSAYYSISDSYENAAFCSLKSGDKQKAHYYFRRSLDYAPHRPRPLLQLAQLDIEAKQFVMARAYLTLFNKLYGQQETASKIWKNLNRAIENN